MSECTVTELREMLPDHANDALSRAARARIEAHLAGCESCRAELALLRSARAAIRRRTPVVDVARISAAVRASGAPTLAPRRAVGPVVWRVAAAIAAVAAGAYLYMASRGSMVEREQLPVVAHAPAASPASSPKPAPLPAPAPRQLAMAPKPPSAPRQLSPRAPAPAGLSFGVEDLSPAQAAAILKELDAKGATLDAEPEGEIDLGSGTR